MFSLRTTKLKPSKLGAVLWLIFAGCCALLLQLFWLPPYYWWGLMLLCSLGACALFAWRYHQGPICVGIDELGAYRQVANRLERLTFIRANGVQLIAMWGDQNSRIKALFWPTYSVIYRDSVPYDTYRLLRSYAMQQMMLKHSEKHTSPFTDKQ